MMSSEIINGCPTSGRFFHIDKKGNKTNDTIRDTICYSPVAFNKILPLGMRVSVQQNSGNL